MLSSRDCIGTGRVGLCGALVATALLAAGCGGTSKSSTGAGKSTPKTAAQYTTAVLSVCKNVKSDAALQKEGKSIANGPGTEDEKFAKILKITTPEYQQFYAVSPPTGDAKATMFHRDLASLISSSAAFQHQVSANSTGSGLLKAEQSIASSSETVAADFKSFGIGSCGDA